MQHTFKALAAAAAISLPIVTASAQEITSISAVFANATGGSGGASYGSFAGGDDVRVCWPGTASATCSNLGSAGISGYSFEREPTPFLPGLNTPFALGLFTHHNFGIPINAGINSVDLVFSFEIGGASPSTFSDTWTLTHQETPNVAGSCPYLGGDPCADRVTFAIAGGTGPTPFTWGGTSYILTLLGFGDTAAQAQVNPAFITFENQANTTYLWAKITTPPNETVPEPATMTLLATGLAGMAAARRRRKA